MSNTSEPGSTNKKTKSKTSLAIYEQLSAEILSLALTPGSMIDENSIAKRFEVSRSPVREAFILLAADGLIKSLPNKNSQVTPLEIDQFPKFIDALDLIQRAVTRLAAQNRTGEDLINIKQQNELYKAAVLSNNVLAMINQNFAFHVAVSDASKNKYFAHAYIRLLNEGRRTLRIYYRSYNDNPPQERVHSHDLIIQAIENQDIELADELAKQHSAQLSDGLLRYLSERSTSKMTIGTYD